MRPTLTYMICTTYRSGSWLLTSTLAGTGLAGLPLEFIEDFGRARDQGSMPCIDEHWLAQVFERGSTANGICGIKVHRPSFRVFLTELEKLRKVDQSFGQLEDLFPNLKFIWLTRNDKGRQAISLVKASQTGQWWVESGSRNELEHEPLYKYNLIKKWHDIFVEDDEEWKAFLRTNAKPHIRVEYERMVDDLPGTIHTILDFLEVPGASSVTIPEPRLAKQSNAQSEWWYQLYKEHDSTN